LLSSLYGASHAFFGPSGALNVQAVRCWLTGGIAVVAASHCVELSSVGLMCSFKPAQYVFQNVDGYCVGLKAHINGKRPTAAKFDGK
jgi:hypothetical protein